MRTAPHLSLPFSGAVFATAFTLFSSVLPVPAAEQPPISIVTAAELPVSLDSRFEFRKATILNNDNRRQPPDTHPMVQFERERINFGAITPEDLRERQGHYYSFYWKNRTAADVTVRLEYRQANLGPFVQAREVAYGTLPAGSHRTNFEIVGDDFHLDGRVIAWRALLVVDGRIVASTESFLWN